MLLGPLFPLSSRTVTLRTKEFPIAASAVDLSALTRRSLKSDKTNAVQCVCYSPHSMPQSSHDTTFAQTLYTSIKKKITVMCLQQVHLAEISC